MPSSDSARMYCQNCRELRSWHASDVVPEEWGDIVCDECAFIISTYMYHAVPANEPIAVTIDALRAECRKWKRRFREQECAVQYLRNKRARYLDEISRCHHVIRELREITKGTAG